MLENSLLEIIDSKKDSLRFYYLGKEEKVKIDHYGVKSSYNPTGVLMI